MSIITNRTASSVGDRQSALKNDRRTRDALDEASGQTTRLRYNLLGQGYGPKKDSSQSASKSKASLMSASLFPLKTDLGSGTYKTLKALKEATKSAASKKATQYKPATQSSGGKATYNVSNFEKTKSGADYVNKNSPFAGYSITSYTGARNTGIKGASTNHAGIDRAVPEGTKVSVPINTTFYRSGSDKARGNWIELKDQNGNILHYQHLQSYAGGYKQGDSIKAGTAFAVSGSTGVGKAHLHEEYYTPDGGTNITESYWNKYAPVKR